MIVFKCSVSDTESASIISYRDRKCFFSAGTVTKDWAWSLDGSFWGRTWRKQKRCCERHLWFRTVRSLESQARITFVTCAHFYVSVCCIVVCKFRLSDGWVLGTKNPGPSSTMSYPLRPRNPTAPSNKKHSSKESCHSVQGILRISLYLDTYRFRINSDSEEPGVL